MRVIETLTVNWDPDPWLGLEALSQYSGLSVRSLRAYLTDPHRPLPHYRMKEPHIIKRKPRQRGLLLRRNGEPRKDSMEPTAHTVTGKILVRRSDFDRWMQTFKHTPDLDRLVDEVVAEFRR